MQAGKMLADNDNTREDTFEHFFFWFQTIGSTLKQEDMTTWFFLVLVL